MDTVCETDIDVDDSDVESMYLSQAQQNGIAADSPKRALAREDTVVIVDETTRPGDDEDCVMADSSSRRFPHGTEEQPPSLSAALLGRSDTLVTSSSSSSSSSSIHGGSEDTPPPSVLPSWTPIALGMLNRLMKQRSAKQLVSSPTKAGEGDEAGDLLAVQDRLQRGCYPMADTFFEDLENVISREVERHKQNSIKRRAAKQVMRLYETMQAEVVSRISSCSTLPTVQEETSMDLEATERGAANESKFSSSSKRKAGLGDASASVVEVKSEEDDERRGVAATLKKAKLSRSSSDGHPEGTDLDETLVDDAEQEGESDQHVPSLLFSAKRQVRHMYAPPVSPESGSKAEAQTPASATIGSSAAESERELTESERRRERYKMKRKVMGQRSSTTLVSGHNPAGTTSSSSTSSSSSSSSPSETKKRVCVEDVATVGTRSASQPIIHGLDYEMKEENLSINGIHAQICALTMTGSFRKKNQDAFSVEFLRDNFLFVGAFDGHGSLGEVASRTCSSFLPSLVYAKFKGGVPMEEAIKQSIHTAHSFIQGVATAEAELVPKDESGMPHSLDYGTTACFVIMTGDALYVANTGDSRAAVFFEGLPSRCPLLRVASDGSNVSLVHTSESKSRDPQKVAPTSPSLRAEQPTVAASPLRRSARRRTRVRSQVSGNPAIDDADSSSTISHQHTGLISPHKSIPAEYEIVGKSGATKKWSAIPLTEDHNPYFDAAEAARVRAHGGKLLVRKSQGECRVYPANMKLADARRLALTLNMSRAVGHTTLADAGIIPNPVVVRYCIRPGSSFRVVLASDGLWDAVNTSQAGEFVSSAENPRSSSVSLAREAERSWQAIFFGDNITIASIFVEAEPRK